MRTSAIARTRALPAHHSALYLALASTALAVPVETRAQQAATAAPAAAPKSSAAKSNSAASSNETVSNDEIIVTGQAVPGAVIGDIPPENQIGPGEIASYGVDSISDLLNEIADQTASISGRDSSSGPVVLVNGKRVSGVNEVGDLPVESVLRVDILPEEVAIKYGYDAQQKVVNIILKRRFQSRVADLGGGLSTKGGGGQGSGAFTYTRIHDNDRVNLTGKINTQAAILESDRDIQPDPNSGITPAAGLSDDRAYRTLQASTRNYALGASLAHDLGGSANLSFNVKGTYKTSRSLGGLADGELTVPADNPFSDGTATTLNRYLSTDPLNRSTNTGDVTAGSTFNVDLSTRWKLSVIASYEHTETDTRTETGYDTAALQAALDAGDPTVDPYGTLSPGLLGNMLTNRAKSNSDTGSASALIFGKLLKLPAGDMGVSLKLGGDFTSQSSTTIREGSTIDGDASRTNGSAKLSVDIPLTSRTKGFLGAIGTLSLNLNGGITQVSDYGTLGTFGYGLNWTPVKNVTVIAAVNEDRSAPTVAQLSNPVITTTNQRVFDYVTGESVLVTTITGGNPNLKADDRHSFKLGINTQLTSEPKLNFSASYVDSRNRNAIMSLGGVTEQVEDAFPDRFIRDDSGTLTSVDSRPVNVYRQRTEQVRWGFNFSAQLRKPKRPERRPGEGPWGGRRFGEQGERPAGGQRPGQTPGQQAGVPQPGQPGADNEITVNGQREGEGPGGGFGPPGGPPPDGFGPPRDGPPPDGFGPPPGEGGPGGPGGPGGGRPGGFGGPGGRGGRGFSGGSDNGMRLLASVYHTWVLRQDVQLTEDSETIDLLHGGTITGNATPQHKVTASLGVIDNGLGFRLEGNWQSATHVEGDGLSSSTGNLHFSSLSTLDLRLFGNLQNRFRGKAWARGTRVSLSIENLFDQRQRVTDATGATPYAYQKDYLDPMGRTVLLSVRRIF
ncbi:outer membrane receptor protein involved in Fe transport [Novosphingobium sp. PhB165]|uniref:TonB-dependent receptor n=1 Tax=Novosphingobium sp. PhB165 TaxID=2485105 RepID=UPI00104B194D|nr:TonB-dependent receptor [Novosphingobium sp. PhB165]TCM22410.1 outer membrane receptor protein involved in Fe transport [Novosphingobium sp. PhB165]